MQEPDIGRAVSILIAEKNKIITITTLFLLFGGLLAFITPKTYASTAAIQLGRVGGQMAYTVPESKNIIQSSAVLESVSRKHAKPVAELKRDMNVQIMTEDIDYQRTLIPPEISITFTADSPEKARDMLSDIINSFFDYANIRMEEMKKPSLLEYNESLRLAQLDYDNTIEQINNQIKEKEKAISEMEKDRSKLEKDLNELNTGSPSSEIIAKTTLLASMKLGLNEQLMSAKENKSGLENNKIQANTNLEQSLSRSKILLEQKLSETEELKILDAPSLPEKSTSCNLPLKLAISVFLGLTTSCAAILAKNLDKLTST